MGARWNKIVFGADVEKMFRQIMIEPAHRDKLRVIWRPSA